MNNENKQYRKEKRNHEKLLCSYRKKLKKIAKNANPYHYEDAVELFMTMLHFMRDYYAENTYVLAEEDPACNRLESLNEAIRLYDNVNNFRNNFHMKYNNTEHYTKENIEKARKEYAELKKKFAVYVSEHIEYWWD